MSKLHSADDFIPIFETSFAILHQSLSHQVVESDYGSVHFYGTPRLLLDLDDDDRQHFYSTVRLILDTSVPFLFNGSELNQTTKLNLATVIAFDGIYETTGSSGMNYFADFSLTPKYCEGPKTNDFLLDIFRTIPRKFVQLILQAQFETWTEMCFLSGKLNEAVVIFQIQKLQK